MVWIMREVCYNFQRGFYSLHLKLNDEEEFEGWLISKSEEVESAENSLEFHTRVITVYSKETKEKGVFVLQGSFLMFLKEGVNFENIDVITTLLTK